ncbi:MAG: transposase [Candidatus Competibacteraceae bacterium]|nr:transposase [Candidatus Competibacteraceae bacterium]
MIIADNVSFHRSKEVRDFDRANRQKIRMFFLPTHSPELNPDEQVWNEVKHRQLGKQPIRSKLDLNRRIHSSLKIFTGANGKGSILLSTPRYSICRSSRVHCIIMYVWISIGKTIFISESLVLKLNSG